uniref:energy transducer TonB n=1 Tax=Flavobacterium sp. TaxID=239 RepID=UPI004048F280
MKKIFLVFICSISFSLYSQNENSKIMSIQVVEELPIAKNCNSSNKKDCFNEKMMEHIKLNFKYPDRAAQKNIQGKVIVSFVINEEGNVVDIETAGAHKILQKEAKRIISLLPKFTSAKHNGKNVSVTYSVPINFKLR